jgi:histidinol-phosphate aminotransferase
LAQVAAIASLGHEDELFVRVRSIIAAREVMEAGLRSLGLQPAESQANFLWLRLGEDTVSFAAACDEAGLSVRPFAGEGVRITVGEPEANTRLVETAAAWVAAR